MASSSVARSSGSSSHIFFLGLAIIDPKRIDHSELLRGFISAKLIARLCGSVRRLWQVPRFASQIFEPSAVI